MTPAEGGGLSPEAAVVVACGGLGARFRGGTGPDQAPPPFSRQDSPHPDAKQFLILAGKPVLAHTLAILEGHPRLGPVALVLPEEYIAYGEGLVSGLWPEGADEAYPKVRAIVSGGDDRQGSVSNGLAALAALGWTGPVLIHDGVRPCTPPEVFDRVIDGVLSRGNAIAAIPVRDTVKEAGGDGAVVGTLSRDGLWLVQTPQGYWMHELQEACHEGRKRRIQTTDDAALMEALGRDTYLTAGDPANIKLTYPEDVFLIEAILRAQGKG